MALLSKNWLNNYRKGELILKVLVSLFMFGFVVVYSYASARYGMAVSLGIAMIPILLFYVWFLLDNPKVGVMTLFVYSYFLMGIYRYYNAFPLGGLVDVIIVMTFIAIIFKGLIDKFDFSPMRSTVALLALTWLVYGVLELANPSAPGVQGWIYAVRGYNIHMWCVLVLSMLLLRKERDVDTFIVIWSIFTLLAVFKGIYQYEFGFNAAEWRWLDSGERNTHILPTGVRIFSFLSDASQFGASMGQSATVFAVLALRSKNIWWQLYFGFVAIMAVVGLSLSGTRGALFIPFMGAVMYVILSKNVKMMMVGGLLILAAFCLIKFTNIGASYYPIRRMRSAFNMNDPSLQVRFKHQRMFREYNTGKPFGSGIGSSYHTASRLYPGTYLSTFATDSWYWAIFAEQGVVGVFLYMFVVLYMLVYGAYICMYKLKDQILAQKMKAFLCGFAGLLVASYANEIIGQFPTSVITYMTLGMIFMSSTYDSGAASQSKSMSAK